MMNNRLRDPSLREGGRFIGNGRMYSWNGNRQFEYQHPLYGSDQSGMNHQYPRGGSSQLGMVHQHPLDNSTPSQIEVGYQHPLDCSSRCGMEYEHPWDGRNPSEMGSQHLKDGSGAAANSDTLKDSFDTELSVVKTQLNDVKTELNYVKDQLLRMDENFSHKLSELTSSVMKILFACDNLEKRVEIGCGLTNNKTSQNDPSSSVIEAEEKTVSASEAEEEFTIVSFAPGDKTAHVSEQEVVEQDGKKEAEETGKTIEIEVEGVKTTEIEVEDVQEVESVTTDEVELATVEHQQALVVEDHFSICSADINLLPLDESEAESLSDSLSSAEAVKERILDDKALTLSATSAIDNFLTTEDMKVIENTLATDFITQDSQIKFVDVFIGRFVEAPKEKQTIMAQILVIMLDSKQLVLTAEMIAQRVNDFPLSAGVKPGNISPKHAQKVYETASKLWAHLANLIGHMLTSNQFNFDHVWHSCKSILYTDFGEKTLTSIFKIIFSLKGPIWVCNKWSSSKVSMDDFTKKGARKILESLDFKNWKENYSSLVFNVSDLIKTPIEKILRRHPSDAALSLLQNWVTEKWGTNLHHKTLIGALSSAISSIVVIGGGSSYSQGEERLDPEPLNNHADLIRFFVNQDPVLEAHFLSEIESSLTSANKFSYAIILNIFSHLRTQDIISLKGFMKFHEQRSYSFYGSKVISELPFFWKSISESV